MEVYQDDVDYVVVVVFGDVVFDEEFGDVFVGLGQYCVGQQCYQYVDFVGQCYVV